MPKFPCTVCGEGFPSEEALLAHVSETHTMQKGGTEKPQKEQNENPIRAN